MPYFIGGLRALDYLDKGPREINHFFDLLILGLSPMPFSYEFGAIDSADRKGNPEWWLIEEGNDREYERQYAEGV